MLCYSFFAFLAAVQVVRSVRVSCPMGKSYCSCPVDESVCEFTLTVEESAAFTSFQILSNGELSPTGTPYFLNATNGYLPAISGPNRPCLFNNVRLVNDEDFTSRGCTVPMTRDGVNNGFAITINGISPGPTLVVDYDATIRIRVRNNLMSEPTSIHWHGMYQRHTPWMDGVGSVTQPSIEAGTFFDYIFQASPFGTHWYHSHVGDQRTEGMFAALVVRGASPPDSSVLIPEDSSAVIIDEPETYTMTLFDPQMESGLELFLLGQTLGFSPDMPAMEFRTGQGMTPVERGVRIDGSDIGPIPFFSGTINGRGRFQNTVTPLTVSRVESNTYYLFRVVGATSREAFMYSIDNHTLRVIALDGKDVDPVDVDYISVETGERYDFLVKTSEPVDNYWIRAVSPQVNVPAGQEYSARAILSYEGAGSLDWRNGYTNVLDMERRCTSESPCRVLNCPFQRYPDISNRECVSLLDLTPRPMKSPTELPKFPTSTDCRDCMHFLNFAFQGGENFTTHSVNTRTNELPPAPYQTNCGQYDQDNSPSDPANTCEKNCPSEGGCSCIHVIPLANDAVYIDDKTSQDLESIVMVFSGLTANTPHPIHVHGHAFQVVYIGYGTYDENGTVIPTTDLICEDPCVSPEWRDGVPAGVSARITADDRVTNAAIQKDTLVIPPGGYVVIAFNADNPGYWYIHCHIESHTIGGMIAILQEYSPDQQWNPPSGINDDGNFVWSVEEYNQHIAAAEMCSDATTASIDRITVSRAGFGIALAILILLAIAVVVLAVLLIITCMRKAGSK